MVLVIGWVNLSLIGALKLFDGELLEGVAEGIARCNNFGASDYHVSQTLIADVHIRSYFLGLRLDCILVLANCLTRL